MQQTPPSIEAFVEANRRWRQSFAWGALDVRPRMHVAILTCMDSRYTAQGILGVGMGDTHVIRNAGGRVTDDAIRSLVLSAHVLGTRTCVVIHHSKCGLYGTSNEAIRERVREATGVDPAAVDAIDFQPFADMEESVREDLKRLRDCRLLPEDYEVMGFVYDVDTGELTPVPEGAAG